MDQSIDPYCEELTPTTIHESILNRASKAIIYIISYFYTFGIDKTTTKSCGRALLFAQSCGSPKRGHDKVISYYFTRSQLLTQEENLHLKEESL